MEEAARLRAVCKALLEVVKECPVELSVHFLWNLSDALAGFPATESLWLWWDEPLEAEDEEDMVELLTEYGGGLKLFTPVGKGAEQLLHAAIGAGALPKLSNLDHLQLWEPHHCRW
jgi:hypothetical protein